MPAFRRNTEQERVVGRLEQGVDVVRRRRRSGRLEEAPIGRDERALDDVESPVQGRVLGGDVLGMSAVERALAVRRRKPERVRELEADQLPCLPGLCNRPRFLRVDDCHPFEARARRAERDRGVDDSDDAVRLGGWVGRVVRESELRELALDQVVVRPRSAEPPVSIEEVQPLQVDQGRRDHVAQACRPGSQFPMPAKSGY